MDAMMLFLVYVSLAVVLALWSRKRGHGFWLGFWYSVVLTPAIGLLTIALTQQVVFVDTGNGIKRSCPHCFNLTAPNVTFCDSCGRHIARQTVKQFLQLAELFVGLVMTVLLVRVVI
ncbi:MAG: hypothetical protein A2X66_07160 [Ignavibacteria bacterium GWA2_54_16]|nr:MAG: hypothetical protein A2X66_07160 [Ignavibacteria bacterium GWA2_54_16]